MSKLKISLAGFIRFSTLFVRSKNILFERSRELQMTQQGFIKFTRRTIAIILTSAIIFIGTGLYYLLYLPGQTQAAWFNDSWGYRQRIPIDTHTASETNVYNEIVVDTATLTPDKLQADCDDLRFTKQDGQLLPYQIVSGCDTATTTIRVGFDTMPIAPFNIYMYYGNPSASAGSSTTATTYATWNPSDKHADISLSNGNLTVGITTQPNHRAVRSTIGKSSGKWYWENTITTVGNNPVSGAMNASAGLASYVGADSNGWGYAADGGKYGVGSGTNGATYTSGDIIGIALDMDAGTMTFYKNGAAQGTNTTGLTGTVYAAQSEDNTATVVTTNFGASAFSGTVPSGYNSGLYTGFAYSACGSGCAEGTFASEEKGTTPVLYWKLNEIQAASATGGTITYTDPSGANPVSSPPYAGGYTVHTFTSTSTFTPATAMNVDALVVAGGGGGGEAAAGYSGGGGGGAGGMQAVTSQAVTAQAYTITVGAGGSGTNGGSGSNSSLGSLVESNGGGGGGSNSADRDPGNGGSGGGAAYDSPNDPGGTGIVGQGKDGGTANGTPNGSGGAGGGGASEVGKANNVESVFVGTGGAGTASSISGSAVTYAGGGGGGFYNSSSGGAGGAGGGGAGGTAPGDGVAGTANRGGGGGGGSASAATGANGGTGGSGIVIIRYLTDGGTTNDSTPNNLDGTTNNTPTLQTEDQCISGKCLYFDGANNENVSKSDDAKLDFAAADSFTISAWVRRSGASSANNFILTKAQSGYTGYKLYQDASGDYCFDVKDGTNTDTACTSAVDFDDSSWHLVQGVKSGTTSITLYVDGVQRAQDASISATGTLANTGTFYVGVDLDGTSNEWLGFLDEIKVYNFALTTAQIKSNYNAKASGDGASAVFGSNPQQNLSNGLVGYWKTDESAWADVASEVVDSSGNALHGRGKNGATTTGGKFGNGGAFDGTNDYATIADNDILSPTQKSLSAWVKFGALGTNDLIIYKASEYGLSYGFTDAGCTASRFNFAFYGGGWYCANSSTAPSTGVWYHVQGTYDGTNIRLYVNGALEATTAVNAPSNAATVFDIGSYSVDATTYAFNGTVDEVRLYNRALSPAEVTQLYEFAPGPVGYWDFEEGSSTGAFDKSGNGNTGTTTGAVYSPGKFGSALNYDGTDDVTTVTNATAIDLNTNSAHTFSTWVYADTDGEGDTGQIYQKGTTTYLRVDNQSGSNLDVEASLDLATTDATLNISTGITTGTWNHIAVSYEDDSDDEITIYINGVNKGSSTNGDGSIAADANNLLIGGTTTANFDGKLDDFRIYNYARTAKQIVSDMNAGHPSVGSPVGSPVSYWKFDEGYSTTAYDSIGNANNLTLSTASWTDSGKFNKAWNGTGALWLSRADDADFDFAETESFSISFWFKSDSATNPSATEYIVNKGPTTAVGYAVYANTSGNICFGIDDDATSFPEDSACSSADIYDNTWHYITAFKTATSRIDLYVDGYSSGSDTSIAATGTLANSLLLYVGDRDGTDNGDEFFGDIDELKIYRYALTASEVKLEMNRGASQVLGALSDNSTYQKNAANQEYCVPGDSTSCVAPVGRWDMEEGTGSTAYDKSGNGNDLTFGTTTVYATWNPSDKSANISLSGGDLVADVSGSGVWRAIRSTMSKTTGKWYWEITVNNVGGDTLVGIATTTMALDNQYPGVDAGSYGYQASNGNKLNTNNSVGYNATYTTGDVIGVAMDLTGATITFYKNGVSQGVAYSSGVSGTLFAAVGSHAEASQYTANFGASAFTYTVPSGYNSGLYEVASPPSYVTGRFGKVLAFNGSDAHLSRADDADFDFADDASFTYSTWIKHDTASAQQVILSKYNEAGYKLIMEADGDLTCALDYDSTWNPTDSATSTLATYDDNKWHYVSCVKNGATSLSLYIDGVLIATNSSLTASNAVTNSDPLYLGIDADSTSNDWIGSLDQTQIFNYARTPAQVAWDYNRGRPIAHWKFDECQGTTAYDSSGNSNSGTITVGATGTYTSMGTCPVSSASTMWYNGATGKRNYSLAFDGTDDYVTMGDPSSGILDFGTGDFTLSAWIKSTDSAGIIMSKYTGGAGWDWNSEGGLVFTIQDAGGSTSSSAQGTVADGNWHHVVVVATRSGNAIQYVDGYSVGTTSISSRSGTVSNSDTFRIGVRSNGLGFLVGQVDDPRAYNYALTATQVKTLYSDGAARFGPSTGAP